jgi:hypothetical protein
MPVSVVVAVGLICAFASAVNGILGAGFLIFMWAVLVGMIRQSQVQAVQITEWTSMPHLLLPVALFLIIWQLRLRGKIGPQWGLRDLLPRSRSGYA